MNDRFRSVIKCICFCFGLMIIVSVCDYVFAKEGYVRYIIRNLSDENQNYDTIVLGASHARSAINPQKIDDKLGTNTLNMAIPGETIKDSYYVLKESDSSNDVEKVILDVDYQYWMCAMAEGSFNEPFIYIQLPLTSSARWEYIVNNMENLDIRNVFSKRLSYEYSVSAVKNNIKQKMSKGYKNSDISTIEVPDANGPYVGKGFFHRVTSGAAPGGLEYVNSWSLESKKPIAKNVIREFEKIYNYCEKNDIELICVTSPITPSAIKILNMHCANATLKEFFDEYDVTYYDFNKARMDVLPREDVDFGDMEGHMGGTLGEEYSEVLADVLEDHEDGDIELSEYFYSSFNEMYENMDEDLAKANEEN
ncbi:MAG: hypothetical protein Q4F11_06930 [Eubacteriales bacterium]|nr:hypothetical protein [Eubacteriales bacterium]